MAAGDEQDLIEAVVTCEGNLHDPDFQDRFRTLVANLKSALYISKTKDPFRVRKIEPWNSVRVTISIPKEAAQKLKLLAQQGSNVLRSMGILSVQVEGDQVISLTWAAQNNEPTQVLIRQTNDEVAASSGTSGVSSSSLPASSPSISSISSSVASISSPVPHTPGSVGDVSGSAVTLEMFSSSSPTLAFRSPNVVAPSGEAIPVLPPKTSAAGVRPAFGGPFPFVSMAHAAQAIQRNEFTPVLSCNNVVVSNSNISGSNTANSTNSIASSIPSSSIHPGAVKSVQPPQMHLSSSAISNNPPSASGTPSIVSTSALTTVNVNSESHVTRLIIENPSGLNSTTQMVGGNVTSLGMSSNNLANSQAGPSQSLQLQLVNVPPPYPGVNTISSNHSLSSSSSNPSGILTSNVQVRHSQQQASILSNVSGSSSSISNLPTIRMVTSMADSYPLIDRTTGGIISNEVPSLAPIANISDSTSGISSLAQPVSSPLLVNLLQNNDAPSGSSTTSSNTDAYNQQLMQKNPSMASRVVTASSDNPQGRYLIQQQQLKKTKRGLSMDGACSSLPKSVPVSGAISGSDSALPTTIPQAASGTESFQFALPLPSDNTVTMNRVSIPVASQNKIGDPLSNQKGTEQNSPAILQRRTIMQGNIRILDQGSGQVRTISLQQQQHPPPPPYPSSSIPTTASAQGKTHFGSPTTHGHGQLSCSPEQVAMATLTNGPLLQSSSELGDCNDVSKSQTVTLVQPDEHQTMDFDASKTTAMASLVADQSRTLLPITTVNIVSKSANKPSSTVNFNSSKDSDTKTFIPPPPPDPRISSQVQKMPQGGNNSVSIKNSTSNLVVQTTSYNTDAKLSASQLNSAGRAAVGSKKSKDRVFQLGQIHPSGKPRQFLINPLTGHLEPMPSESGSDGEGDDGEGRKSNSHKGSSLKNKSSRGTNILSSVHHRQIVTTESGVTVARVVKGPVSLESSTAQSHRELDGRKPTSGDSSVASGLGASVMSVTKKPREDSVTNVALYNQKDVKESNSPGPATVTATSVSGEKIKLRLKLEKSEPISPAYKVDVSFVKKSEKSSILPNVSSGPSGSGAPSASATFSSSSGNQSSPGDQPRVPPLHISLRGKNAAVVVSPRREEKEMPPPPPIVSTKDPLISVNTKDVSTSETSSTTSSLPSHSKSTSHLLNSHEGKSSSSSKSSGIMKRSKGRVKSLDDTSSNNTNKRSIGEKTKTKTSRPKLSKEMSRQDMLLATESQESANLPPSQFQMPVLQPAITSAEANHSFEKRSSTVLSDCVPNTNVLPAKEIVSINNNNTCQDNESSVAAELPSYSCATGTFPTSTSGQDLTAEPKNRTGSQEETAKINSVIEDVILSKSKENMEVEEQAAVTYPVISNSDPSIPNLTDEFGNSSSSHPAAKKSQLPEVDEVQLEPVGLAPASHISSEELNSSSMKDDCKEPANNPSVESCDKNPDFEDTENTSDKDVTKQTITATLEVSAASLKDTATTGATNLIEEEKNDDNISSKGDCKSVSVAESSDQRPSMSLMTVVQDETEAMESMDVSVEIPKHTTSTPNTLAEMGELSTEGLSEGEKMEVVGPEEINVQNIVTVKQSASPATSSSNSEVLEVDSGLQTTTLNSDASSTSDNLSKLDEGLRLDFAKSQQIAPEPLIKTEGENLTTEGEINPDQITVGSEKENMIEDSDSKVEEVLKVVDDVLPPVAGYEATNCISSQDDMELKGAECIPIAANKDVLKNFEGDLADMRTLETCNKQPIMPNDIDTIPNEESTRSIKQEEIKEKAVEVETDGNLVNAEACENEVHNTSPEQVNIATFPEIPDSPVNDPVASIDPLISVSLEEKNSQVDVLHVENDPDPVDPPSPSHHNENNDEKKDLDCNPCKETSVQIDKTSATIDVTQKPSLGNIGISTVVTPPQLDEMEDIISGKDRTADKTLDDVQSTVVEFLGDTKEQKLIEQPKPRKASEEQSVVESTSYSDLRSTEGDSVNEGSIEDAAPSSENENVIVETFTKSKDTTKSSINEIPSEAVETVESVEESILVKSSSIEDNAIVDQPLESMEKKDDYNLDTVNEKPTEAAEKISTEELTISPVIVEQCSNYVKQDNDDLTNDTPTESEASSISSKVAPTVSGPTETTTHGENDHPSMGSEYVEDNPVLSDDNNDSTVNVTIVTLKSADPTPSPSAMNSPPISIVLPSESLHSNNQEGKPGTSKNSYKRRAEIKPGALQNTLKRLHDNFFPKVLKSSDDQDVTSQQTEDVDDEDVDEPPVSVVEPVQVPSHSAPTLSTSPNKETVTVTQSSHVSMAVSQVRSIKNVTHRPKMTTTSIPITTTTQATLHQISSGLQSNLLANVSVGLSSSSYTSVTSISVPSTSAGGGPQTVFAIHPNVSIPANFAQLQQSSMVLPGGHKMVPIKLVTLPKQSGGQLQTIPLGNATPNRSSPNLLEAVNIVANAGSRSSSPKTTLRNNAMQSTPLNLGSMSLPVGSNLHFVPISVSSATGSTSNVKVLMTQPIKMQQAGLSQSMVVKSVLMGSQPATTIRVIRPSNLQEPISLQTLIKQPTEQASVNKPKASNTTLDTPVFKTNFIVQQESMFKKLDGVEIVETGSPLNNDDLPFEADIIHDEKDLADVLASEAKSEMIPMENCANFSISFQNDSDKVAEAGVATKAFASASKASSIPNHVKSKSLLHMNRDNNLVQGSPSSTIKRTSPAFTYSSATKSSRNRNSPSRSPSPLNQNVPDLHGEDQEIINTFSGSPSSASQLLTQNKSQPQEQPEGKMAATSDLLPDHTYGITSGINITNNISNNIDEVLSIEIPPIDIEVAATMSPSQNVTEEKRCTRSTRSNTRLSPDITAFVSDTPKPTKLSAKVDPLLLKNSPKPSPTGSLKVLSPTPSSLTITPSTSTRSSPILNSQHQVNASNAAATINAVALGIIDKIQGNATAQNAKNSRISKLAGSNKRKRQESDSSNASRDENNEEKAEIDLNSRPGKRKCSENAAEMIKVCIGVEDSPKRYSTSNKKADDTKNKGRKGLGSIAEEDDDADSEVSLSRGRSRSSRESSEDRSSSRGSSVQRVVSSSSSDKPKSGKDEDQPKDTKSGRVNSRLNKESGSKLKSQADKTSAPPAKKAKETGKVTPRRPNQANLKNKSPLSPAKTRTNVRKEALTSNTHSDKSVSTPSSNTNPESENARRKTRSSATGKRHTT